MSTTAEQLNQKMAALLDEVQSIEDRFGTDRNTMPAGQAQRHDSLVRAIQALDADLTAETTRLERAEQRAAQKREVAEGIASGKYQVEQAFAPADVGGHRNRSNPWANLGDSITNESASGYRQRAADVLELVPAMPQANRQRFQEMVDSDLTGRSATFVVAASDPQYVGAFTKMLKDPQRGFLTWSPQERESYARVEHMRASLSLTDTAGGFLVPWSLLPEAMVQNAGASSPFRQVARLETTATDTLNLTATPGITAEWLPEATAAANAGPAFSRATIKPEKLAAYIQSSYELIADSDIAQQLPRLIADAFAVSEANGFATGSGTNQPWGLVTRVAATTTSRVAPTTGGTFSSASIADVYKVYDALTTRARNHPSAGWLASNTTLSTIRRMGEAAGGPGASFWTSLADGVPSHLLGLPVYESSAMTSTVTTGSALLVAGAFNEYCVVDRLGGTTMVFHNMVTSTASGTGTGEAAWFCYRRVGGDTLNNDAFRALVL
jgi:HK97 family phage major capsid protein